MQMSRLKTALFVSLLVHVLIVIALAVWYFPRNARTGQVADRTMASTDQNSSDNSRNPPPKPDPIDDHEVDSEQIHRSIQSQIESVERLSEEEKRSELEKNLRRLESISDQESVVKTSQRIADALGLDSSQYMPRQPPEQRQSEDASQVDSSSTENAGESSTRRESSTSNIAQFDTNTAQLDDVVRRKSDQGSWVYESIMVDASGRKLTVPMTASEGESLFNTFQTMKQFPVAKGIYRSVVMPMMQKMMEAEEFAEKADKAAREIQASESVSEATSSAKTTPDAKTQQQGYPEIDSEERGNR